MLCNLVHSMWWNNTPRNNSVIYSDGMTVLPS